MSTPTLSANPAQWCDPGAGDIHAWLITPPGGAETSPGWPLSAAEVARAERFVDPAQGDHWAHIRRSLRCILGRYCGQDPAALELAVGEKGKPEPVTTAAGNDLHFSLSHAGELALLAVTGLGAIGADIERPRPLTRLSALVARYFSPAEQTAIGQLTAEQQRDAFFNLWTCKEAVIKATGDGLSAPLSAFDISLEHEGGWEQITTRPPLPPAEQWLLHRLSVTSGYHGALALWMHDIPPADSLAVRMGEWPAWANSLTR